jgi:multidrug resistance efflux pump
MPKSKPLEIPEFHSTDDYLSNEVQEILGKPPHWLATWGTAAIVCSVMLLLLVSIVFSYPDTIQGDFTLKTSEPPAPVISNSSGYLAELRVTEGTMVRSNELLAVFASNASADDVLKLDNEVDKLSEFSLEALKLFTPDWELKLGDLAPFYTSFVSAVEYLPFSRSFSIDEVAISGTNEFISTLQQDVSQLRRQKAAKLKELNGAQSKMLEIFTNYSNSGDQNEGKKLVGANKTIGILQHEINDLDSMIKKRSEDLLNNKAKMLELQVNSEAGAKDRIFQIKQHLSNLKSEINKWKEQHLVFAPASGKVSFFNELSEKQFRKAGDELMIIVPATSNNVFMGQVKLPAHGSAKVVEGQDVTIKIDRYPFREYGVLSGKVSKTYDVPSGNAYYVDVTLIKGLRTDKDKELDFKYNLTGKAEITTANKSFFSRLFTRFL